MSRTWARSTTFAASAVLAALSLAASPARAEDCPDGWFCDQTAPSEPPPPAEPRPAPPELGEPPPPPELRLDRLQDDWEPQPIEERRSRRPHHVRREWGFNLHVDLPLVGHDSRAPRDSSMGGLGLGLRYRVIPHLALDSSVEWVSGNDYEGFKRDETAGLFNALFFLNPRDAAQVYLLGGLGIGTAFVKHSSGLGNPAYEGPDARYWYFGGQMGLGLDIRINRHFAITTDLLGILRGRIDDNARNQPEFVDPKTHRATNSSGAGLFRLGATFYW